MSDLKTAFENHITDDDRSTVKATRAFWEQYWLADPYDLDMEDHDYAFELANQWNTCACGSLDDGIPRDRFGDAPEDKELHRLGMRFMAVLDDAYNCGEAFMDINHGEVREEAFELWMRIHVRGAEVLKEEGLLA